MQLMQKSAVAGKVAAKAPARRAVVVKASAQEVTRRAALSGMASAAALLAGAAPSFAAFGDSANVFGRKTNTSGFVPYAGEGFALKLPSKWNPSKEKEFANIVLRYEDNFDQVNSLLIIVEKTDKTSIDAYGTPEKFLEQFSFLLGKQSYAGQTQSEGGFAPNRVSAASLLDVQTQTDKKGRKVYLLEVLTRTADGDEGGRHQLVKALVANGNLYVMKVQIGDKRWIKGANLEALGSLESFTVA